MLEQVTRARRAGALLEQLVDHELTEAALQHVFLDPGQGTDHLIGKLASQHRAQLRDSSRASGCAALDHLSGAPTTSNFRLCTLQCLAEAEPVSIPDGREKRGVL